MNVKNIIAITLMILAITFNNVIAQTWVQMSPSTPPTPRYDCAMAYNSKSDRIVIFGGYRTGEWLNDVWEYDLNNDTCIQRSPLPDYGRVGPRMVYDSENDKIILFGGYTAILGYENPNDTWEYDLNNDTWTNKFPSNPPIGRSGAGMVYDSESKKVVMFGGFNFEDLPIDLNDTWVYDLSTNTWTEMYPDTSPHARHNHGMVYDSQSDKIILFGGEYNDYICNDTWEYDLNTNTWTEKTPIDSIPDGFRCGMAYDSKRDRTVLFTRPNEPQTWEYNLDTNTWTRIFVSNSPSIRSCPGMAYDSESERIVLFGGHYGTTYYNDIWIYEPLIGINEQEFVLSNSKLIKVFPNPFSEKAVIKIGEGSKNAFLYSSPFTLRVYDISGRLIQVLQINDSRLTINEVVWDGKDKNEREIKNGIYFLKVNGFEPIKVIRVR